MYQNLVVDRRVCRPCWSFAFAVFQHSDTFAAAGAAIARFAERYGPHSSAPPDLAPGEQLAKCGACLGYPALKLDLNSAVGFLAFVANQPPADQDADPDAEQPATTLQISVPVGTNLLARAAQEMNKLMKMHAGIVGPVTFW